MIARKRENGSKWLVILMTDHGGIGDGHGNHTKEERDAFIILFDPDDPNYHGNKPLRKGRGLDAVTPTVLQYLIGREEYRRVDFPLLSAPLEIDNRKNVKSSTVTKDEGMEKSAGTFWNKLTLFNILSSLLFARILV
jgi:hypothetical protein